MQTKILVIEDEERAARLICRYLERASYEARMAHDGSKGLELARSWQPDLILLDLMLPGISGGELCMRLRRDSEVPIIMLTARGAREDRISGLEKGADDYIVKPYDPDELLVRIKAVLRRSRSTRRSILSCGSLELDMENRQTRLSGTPVELTAAQFDVLAALARQPGNLLSREQIMDMAFGSAHDSFERAVDTHIRRIRARLKAAGEDCIETVYGAGYRLRCP